VRIRRAEASDAGRLGAIEVSAGERFRTVGLDAVADDPPLTPDVYARAIADDAVWVAEDGAEAIGYAWVIDLGGQTHLEQLSVVDDRQGRGVGGALLDEVVRWAAAGGAASITLSTFRDVAFNGPWYRRHGFVDVADPDERFVALRRHEAESGLDISARVIMRRPLASAAPLDLTDPAGGPSGPS